MAKKGKKGKGKGRGRRYAAKIRAAVKKGFDIPILDAMVVGNVLFQVGDEIVASPGIAMIKAGQVLTGLVQVGKDALAGLGRGTVGYDVRTKAWVMEDAVITWVGLGGKIAKKALNVRPEARFAGVRVRV